MLFRPIGSRMIAEDRPTDAVTMAPSRPTPTAPPIVRLNWTRPVETARRCQGTAAWTMTRIVVAERPIPRPVIASPSAATARPPPRVPGRVAWVTTSVPNTSIEVPTSTVGRAPQRRRARPPAIEPIGQPIDMAATATPAWSALPPMTPCTSGGTYVERLNITIPERAPIAIPAPITGTASRARSMSGSWIRRSRTTKTTSSATAPTARPIVAGEVRPQICPPSVAAKSSATRATVSSPAPRKSSRWRWCSTRSCRKRPITSAARIPTGAFTKKTHRQPIVVVITLPISGPTRAAAPQTPEKRP